MHVFIQNLLSQGQEPASNENLKIYDPDPDRIFTLLRTGHYLSPVSGEEDFRGGIAENFGRIEREDHSNFLGK